MCSFCKKKFGSGLLLMNHLKSCHVFDINIFILVCNIFNESKKWRQFIRDHLISNGTNGGSSASPSPPKWPDSPKPVKRVSFSPSTDSRDIAPEESEPFMRLRRKECPEIQLKFSAADHALEKQPKGSKKKPQTAIKRASFAPAIPPKKKRRKSFKPCETTISGSLTLNDFMIELPVMELDPGYRPEPVDRVSDPKPGPRSSKPSE